MRSFQDIYDACNLREETYNVNKIMNSPKMPPSYVRAARRLKGKGIEDVTIGDKPVRDLHGRSEIEKEGFELYGRGGWWERDEQPWADNGMTPGHPPGLHNNYYWGIHKSDPDELRVRGARVGAEDAIKRRFDDVGMAIAKQI